MIHWTEDHKLTLKRAIEVLRTDGICFNAFGVTRDGRTVNRDSVATDALTVCTIGALEKVRARYGLPHDMLVALAQRLHLEREMTKPYQFLTAAHAATYLITHWHDDHYGIADGSRELLAKLEALLED